MRPFIAHGCAVWLPSSVSTKQILETWQYKSAKLFLVLMNIPKSALFVDLGWEPINDFLDRQRVSYFARIYDRDKNRLCRIIFDELKVNLIISKPFFGSFFCEREFKVITNKSSINAFSKFNLASGRQPYLSNLQYFKSTRLKLLARTNCLPFIQVL